MKNIDRFSISYTPKKELLFFSRYILLDLMTVMVLNQYFHSARKNVYANFFEKFVLPLDGILFEDNDYSSNVYRRQPVRKYK